VTGVRTSADHPIRVAWLVTPALPGSIGLTFAPGKHASSLTGPAWARDLATDLDALRGEGVDLLAPLLEDDELVSLRIPTLVAEATARGMRVVRSPVRDGGVPDPAEARALVERLVGHARGGGRAVVHCRGGLGRAGTIAACCLVALGARADDAMAAVRAVRRGAIENELQEAFVRSFSR
jgi:protein-tyrosine phosphatase